MFKYIKIVLIISIIFLFNFLIREHVYAQEVSMGIYPSIFQITINPPEVINTPFTIKNYSNSPLILEINIKPFRASNKNNGQINYINEKDSSILDPSIFQRIQVLQENQPIDQLILGPQEEKTLVLNLSIPKDEPESDYYFSILLTSKPTQMNQNTSQLITGGIATNILLAIGTKAKKAGNLTQFSSPLFLLHGPVPFQIAIQNSGKHYITPQGIVLIKNMFGQIVGTIKLLPINILSNSVRYVPDSSLQSNIYAEWPESFLVGLYTAEITIALSPDGPLFKKTITFIALPIPILISLLITSLLIGLIIYRIKRNLS